MDAHLEAWIEPHSEEECPILRVGLMCGHETSVDACESWKGITFFCTRCERESEIAPDYDVAMQWWLMGVIW